MGQQFAWNLETIMKNQWGMENEPESPSPKTRLRWYQYRLRTLLIIMTVFAAWMAWVSHHARQQKLAVAKIRAIHGKIIYDYQKTKGKNWDTIDRKALPPNPKWLRDWVGEDYFQTVVQIDLSQTSASDNDLAILKNIPNLESLTLNSKISSKGLSYLQDMKNLKGLVHEGALIDDNGLGFLSNLTDLRVLSLDGLKITDAGIEKLQKLTKLEMLFLMGSPITDASLKTIKKFKNLQFLGIVDDSQITKNGLSELKKELPNVEFMDGIDIKPTWLDILKGIFYK
jgi:hypothetical protein